MKQWLGYRYAEICYLLGIAILYALIAKLALVIFFSAHNLTLLWFSGGLGLATLLLGGLKYWPAIFIGSLGLNLSLDFPVAADFFIALGNCLESVCGAYLLGRCRYFHTSLTHPNHYLSLLLCAGLVSFLSAFIGPSSLLNQDLISPTHFTHIVMSWWRADVGGIFLITPLILVWRSVIYKPLQLNHVLEGICFWSLSFLAGQVIFLGWFNNLIGAFARGYWMFLFVFWVAVRFQKQGVTLFLLMVSAQGLLGILHDSGFFSRDGRLETAEFNFWLFLLILSTVGISLVLSIEQRKRSDDFKQSVLDAIPTEIAVLNEHGIIVAVNKAWQKFARENGIHDKPAPHTGVGENYLSTCQQAHGSFSEEATQVYNGIQAVLNAKQACFTLEYPCHSPTRQRWFLMTVTPLQAEYKGAVISHLDISERKYWEQSLLASEERLRLAQAGAHAGVWDWNLQTGVMDWTVELEKLYEFGNGVHPNTQMDFIARIHPDDRDYLTKGREQAIATRTAFNLDFRILLPSDNIKWANCKGSAQYDENGQPVRVLGVTTDITARKLSELALRERETFLDFALTSMCTGAWEYDLTTRTTYRTLMHDRIFGYSQLLPVWTYEMFLEHVIPEDRQRVDQSFQAVLTQEADWNIEYRIKRQDGEIRWLWGIAQHRFNQERQAYSLAGIVQDISERKTGELVLQTQHERLQLAKLASNMGIWDYSLVAGTVTWDSKMYEIWGVSAEQSVSYAFFINSILPEDRAMVESTLNKYHVYGTADKYSLEYRIIQPATQKIVWILAHAQVFFRDQQPIRVVGTARDISERKKAEEALQLAALVYENSPWGMIITDADTHILSVNPAFTRITGYSAEEVVGKNPNILSSGRHDNAFYAAMWQALNTCGYWCGEIWNRQKDGRIFPEEITINTIFNPDGNPKQRVAMFFDISDKKQSEVQLWQQANFDFLTGLPNRHLFYDHLVQEMKKTDRSGLLTALMFLDLDRFKEVNDSLGHSIGDELLQQVSKRLINCVRKTDTLARLGGDEFTIVLSEIESIDNPSRVAQCILKTLAEPFMLGEEPAYISVSIGITLYPTDGGKLEQLLQNADQAMYAAKAQGRNGYCYFKPEMQEEVKRRMHLINDLRRAITDQQFVLYYQPIVDLHSGNIYKAEALVRWQHPLHGLISPGEFIPVAEETNLIIEIGEWIFHTAAQQVLSWRKYCPEFQISVNKSPLQFRSPQQSPHFWLDYLHSLGLPGQSIVVEITEGLLLDDSSSIKEHLFAYRDGGMQVAIDDFGTGYSALSYLNKFDIDYLKIDQSFTRNLAPDSNDLALCEAIIVMAHRLGLKVIAEGIETEQQRDLLVNANCDYGQGYFFAKPLTAEEFTRLLTTTAKADQAD